MSEDRILFDFSDDGRYSFQTSIETAIEKAQNELTLIRESVDSVSQLRPQCDRLDYILAACSGVLTGLMDVFLVGKPKESKLGTVTDKWFEERVKDFAKHKGWNNNKDSSLRSAIEHLENKYKVPYDQKGIGDAGKEVFNLKPNNHHFKSLGHNPTLMGLFFSILDQFSPGDSLSYTSHFVTEGELLVLNDIHSGEVFVEGRTIPAKIYGGFVNWFGHLVSDVSGSNRSKGRGMGIPSPFYAWANDLVVIRRKLGIESSEFDKFLCDYAEKIYLAGFDFRYQVAQSIPVIVNELVVRLIYCIRRFFGYLASTPRDNRNLKNAWSFCEPFSNPTIKRMLTVAHGVFCLIDVGEATIRGLLAPKEGLVEFFLRLNLTGVGRFTVSLFGEVKRNIAQRKAEADAEREKEYSNKLALIIEDYLAELKRLSVRFDETELMNLAEDFKSSEMYIYLFKGSVKLAEMRNVSEKDILRTKTDIDNFFLGGKSDNGKGEE